MKGTYTLYKLHLLIDHNVTANNIYSKTNTVAMSSLLQPSNLQLMRKHYNNNNIIIMSLCMATIRP